MTKTAKTTKTMYYVLNGDGIIVAQYEEIEHAIESARENAAAAAIDDPTNFYSVALADGSSPSYDGPTEFLAKDFS